MGRKRYQPEQIICKQRAPEVLLANAGFGTVPPYYSLFKNVLNFHSTHNSFSKKYFPLKNT